jgi:hypothetical protein
LLWATFQLINFLLFVEPWALKFNYDVDILVFFGHSFQNLGEILFNFLVTLLTSLFWQGREHIQPGWLRPYLLGLAEK